jgi:hypothetical protein
MGTKNNPKNRKTVEKKKFNGKEIEPILYHGVNVGHGKYMSAKYSGTSQIISDNSGKPLPWDEVS